MFRSTFLSGALVLVLSNAVHAQSYVFTMTDATAAPGSSVSLSLLITNNTGNEIEGYTFGICHNPTQLSIFGVMDGPDLDLLVPDFSSSTLYPGGCTGGVIFSFSGTVTLGTTTDFEAHVVGYEFPFVSPTAVAAVCFCDTLGSPPVLNTITQSGLSESVDEQCGAVIVGSPAPEFRRGEVNGDGAFDISDAIFELAELFAMGPAASCADAGDVNDDGVIDIADPVLILDNLFGSGLPISSPGPVVCGTDPTPDVLDCVSSSCP